MKFYKILQILFAGLIGLFSVQANADLISYKDAAAFSLLVYHDQKDEVSVPDGFFLLCTCPIWLQNKNYYGEAYYKYAINESNGQEMKRVTIVITHRGTILKSGNLEDDLLVALHAAPESFILSSRKFTEYVIDLAYKKFTREDGFWIHNFVHVGHSLGAIHAELNNIEQTIKSLMNPFTDIQAIVFESPGSRKIIESLMITKDMLGNSLYWGDTTVINSDINLINSFNQQAHYRKVRRIYTGYTLMNIPGIDINPIDIKYFSSIFTADQHSMSKIYKYFKNGGDVNYNHNDYGYIYGVKDAFEYYKTYCEKSDIHYADIHHRNYWDMVLKDYWDRHDQMHSQYNNSFLEYKQYTIDHHLNGCDKFYKGNKNNRPSVRQMTLSGA